MVAKGCFSECAMSIGFRFKSPAAPASLEKASLSLELLKPGVDVFLTMKVLDGIFQWKTVASY